MNKTHNIISGIILVFVPLVYFYGVLSWKSAQFSSDIDAVTQGKHIYFVCFSSAFYGAASVAFLLAKPKLLKFIASTVSSVCAVILYEEIRYSDKQWTVWSYWLIPLVALNYFIYYCIIEKYKKSIKYE
jgi:hypothetical protein